MLKRLGDKALQEIVEICQSMYEEGKWSDDFTRVAMITLPKENNAAHFSDCRTISRVCHASKIMLKVFNREIRRKSTATARKKSVWIQKRVRNKGCDRSNEDAV